jgi:hypothetical protein
MEKRTRFWIRTLGAVGAACLLVEAAVAQGDPCACADGECNAATVTETGFFENQPPNNTTGANIPVPKFNPALGTLKKVEYVAEVALIDTSFSFTNTNTTSECTVDGFTFILTNRVQPPAGVPPAEMFPAGVVFDCSAVLNQVLQEGGQPGSTFETDCPPKASGQSDVFDLCSNDTPLGTFIGNGNVNFKIFTDTDQSLDTDCNNLQTPFTSQIRVDVTVTYTYCVDAPTLQNQKKIKQAGSLAPIVFDVLFNSDPGGENCEFVLPAIDVDLPQFGQLTLGPGQNQVTYTPFANFPAEGEDSFCISLTTECGGKPSGCIATACFEVNEAPLEECVERNRRNCGSLLLYPEFDNRQGRHTLYTITYGCCDDLSSDIWVEFIYIDATDHCSEENRTAKLTPCDTFTFLTSVHALPVEQGYMYAFAKSGPSPVTAGGPTVPIVANRLIGSLFQVNGIEIHKLSHRFLSYTMNAVSFKAVGDVEGVSTDHDFDGVRDLDGEEYEEAPDQILIPSFLGQDPSDQGISSDLILIALSGGSEFDTTVFFSIYDDDEHAESATHTFYCWEKVRLRSVSSAFLNSHLLTLDDPINTGIGGYPQRQTGWMRIDGFSASSDFESIEDPAIYAVLIEQHFYELFAAAELPFELCSQDNGDLLPTNVFGDPNLEWPSGEPGDNQ